jgi:hypothetical protein
VLTRTAHSSISRHLALLACITPTALYLGIKMIMVTGPRSFIRQCSHRRGGLVTTLELTPPIERELRLGPARSGGLVILPAIAGLARVNRFYDSCHICLPCSLFISELSCRCSRSFCR